MEPQRPTNVFFAVIPCVFCALACAAAALLVLDPDVPRADALFKIFTAAAVSASIGTVGAWWGKPYAFGCGGLMAAILALLGDSRAWTLPGQAYVFVTRISAAAAVLLFVVVATQYRQIQSYGEARKNPNKRWP